jgi:SNF2 family DNA or RNA helicase
MKKQFAKAEEERRRLYKIFGDRIKDGPSKQSMIDEYKKKLEDQVFPNGGKLRDYQAEGVSWLLSNHINERSSILADGKGLLFSSSCSYLLQVLFFVTSKFFDAPDRNGIG